MFECLHNLQVRGLVVVVRFKLRKKLEPLTATLV
jgi:hypothetical protein